MRWKFTVLLWCLAILALPLGGCVLYDGLTGMLRRDLNAAVSLYVSLVGIMVTAFLTWYVYRAEHRREEAAARKEEEDAKRTLAVLLRTGVSQAIFPGGSCIQISDELLRMVTPASRRMSLEQMTALTSAMQTLKNVGEVELQEGRWEACEAAGEFASSFLPPPCALFPERMREVENWEWLVEGPLREVFQALGTPLASRPPECGDKQGRPVFAHRGGGRYQVWSAEGRMVLDGIVSDGEVAEGYAELKLRSDRDYCGHFRDGQMEGEGVEFFSEAEERVVAREGQWAGDELVDGTIYQAMLDDAPKEEEDPDHRRSPYEWLFQFADPSWVRANEAYMPPFRMCNVRVTDGELQVIEESIQTVDEFCEEWRPRLLEMPRPIGEIPI